MRPQPNYIPNLTPLRGFAALVVVVFHFEELVAMFVQPQHSMIIRKGYLMVDLFFIMSGFVMLHVYGSSFGKTFQWPVFARFIKARFARLYPLHLFTLLLAVAFFYGTHQPPNPVENPAAIPTHLLLLQSFGIHNIFTWNVPSWSISAEWWAYMLFPILALLLGKNKKPAIAFMFLVAIVLYVSVMYLLPRVNPFVPTIPVPHTLDVTYDYGFIRGIAGFMAGMVTYTFYQQKKLLHFFAKDIAGLLCVALLLATLHLGLNDLIYIPVFMLIVLAIAANNGIIHRICMLQPLQYLGDISYSIYLVHGQLIFLVAVPIIEKMGFAYKGPGSLHIPFWKGVLCSSIFIVVVIAVSSITYYFIEKPCRRWINGLSNKPSAPTNIELQRN